MEAAGDVTPTAGGDSLEAAAAARARRVLKENQQRADQLQNVLCILQGKQDAAKHRLEEAVTRHVDAVVGWKAAFRQRIDSEFVHKASAVQAQLAAVRRATVGLHAGLERLEALRFSPAAAAGAAAVVELLDRHAADSRGVRPDRLLDFAFREVPADRRARSRLAVGFLQTGALAPTDLTLAELAADGLRVTLRASSSAPYDPATVSHLSYSVLDADGGEVTDVEWRDGHDGTLTVTLHAGRPGPHTVSVYMYSVHVNGSPCRVLAGAGAGQHRHAAVQTDAPRAVADADGDGDGDGDADGDGFVRWMRGRLERELSDSGRQDAAPRDKPLRRPALDVNDNVEPAADRPARSASLLDRPAVGPRRAEDIRLPTAERLRSALAGLTVRQKPCPTGQQQQSCDGAGEATVPPLPGGGKGSPHAAAPSGVIADGATPAVRGASDDAGGRAKIAVAEAEAEESDTLSEWDRRLAAAGDGPKAQSSRDDEPQPQSSHSAGDGPAMSRPKKSGEPAKPPPAADRDDRAKPRLKSVVVAVVNDRQQRTVRLSSAGLRALTPVDACAGPMRAELDLLLKPTPAFSRPIGVATDGGALYVADTGGDAVRAFSADGAEAAPVAELRRPSALVPLSGGRLALRYDYGVRVYAVATGRLLRQVGHGTLRRPFGLARTASERLVTVETAGRRPTVHVFDASAAGAERLVHSVDLSAAVARPDTAKLRFVAASETRVAVVDLGNDVVYLLNWEGRLVAAVGAHASLSDPAGCVMDAHGGLLVADSKHHRILTFGADGSPRGAIDTSHQLNRPSGLWLSGRQLFVLNYWDNTLHRYTLTDGESRQQ